MKEIKLGRIKSCFFVNYLALAFSKDWLDFNNGKPLEFEAKLTKDGQLVLSSRLSQLDRTKRVDNNEI